MQKKYKIVCTPTTGSPTITLFQLRSNYHTVYNSPGDKHFYIIVRLWQATKNTNNTFNWNFDKLTNVCAILTAPPHA